MVSLLPIALVTWIHHYFSLAFISVASFCFKMAEYIYTHISLPLYSLKLYWEKAFKNKNRVNLKQWGEKYPSVDNNIGKVVKAVKMIDKIFLNLIQHNQRTAHII